MGANAFYSGPEQEFSFEQELTDLLDGTSFSHRIDQFGGFLPALSSTRTTRAADAYQSIRDSERATIPAILFGFDSDGDELFVESDLLDIFIQGGLSLTALVSFLWLTVTRMCRQFGLVPKTTVILCLLGGILIGHLSTSSFTLVFFYIYTQIYKYASLSNNNLGRHADEKYIASSLQ